MARKNLFSSSSNPMFSEKMMSQSTERAFGEEAITGTFQFMTAQGASNKSIILGLIVLVFAAFGFLFPSNVLLIGSGILGFVMVLIASFKPQYSKVLAPLYAVFEGVFVGGITAIYAAAFDGLVANAILLTMALFFSMLFLYKAKIITVTQKFRAGVIMATMGVFLVYLASWILSFFGIEMPFLHETGLMGIGISVVFIGIACMNLLLDFDNFDRGEAAQLPKHMEWFFAMGLIVTIVWLYLEVLRLLSKLARD